MPLSETVFGQVCSRRNDFKGHSRSSKMHYSICHVSLPIRYLLLNIVWRQNTTDWWRTGQR